MRLLVISSAPIIRKNGQNSIYLPYGKEMKLWAKYADTIQFCCPIWEEDRNLLISPICFKVEDIIELKEFDVTSFLNKLKAIPLSFVILLKIFKAIKGADHIHLRCPGNIALLACFVQILFPQKIKTAKYAGNWDPKSKQPLSYRIQKWILSNTYLTKNMRALVYGEWDGSSKNIKPFFTATYSEEDMVDLDTLLANRLALLQQSKVRLLFVGTLSKGKQPLYAIELAEQLRQLGYTVRLDLYGEGVLRNQLEAYILEKDLLHHVFLQGNQTADTIKEAYKESHFLILPSQSEGWPKVVAESMFWGCVPVATPVSCIPTMLNQGQRGLLLTMNIKNDIQQFKNMIHQKKVYQSKATQAAIWSRQYTVDYFEAEIRKLVQSSTPLDTK